MKGFLILILIVAVAWLAWQYGQGNDPLNLKKLPVDEWGERIEESVDKQLSEKRQQWIYSQFVKVAETTGTAADSIYQTLAEKYNLDIDQVKKIVKEGAEKQWNILTDKPE